MIINFILNGEDVSIKAEPLERLSVLLREGFELSSLLNDCMSGICGKCLVFYDGKLVNSCLIPAFKVRRHEIITFEGFLKTENCKLVSKAFFDTEASTCTFCKAAVYMAAGSLLDLKDRPNENTVLETMSSVYCRCQTPSAILEAVKAALDIKFGGKYNRAH